MKRSLIRSIALSLITALTLNSSLLAAGGSFTLQRPVPTTWTSAFKQEALSLATLSQKRFRFQPFRSYWERFSALEPLTQLVRVAAPLSGIAAVFVALKAGLTLHQLFLYGGFTGVLMALGSPPPESFRIDHQAAMNIYRVRESSRGFEDFEFSTQVRAKYAEFAKISGLEPDPHVLSLAYLTQASEKEVQNAFKPLLNKKKLADLLAEVRRLDRAFKTPYLPPENLFEMNPDAAVNQMGLYGKTLNSFDELLLVIARKMVTLENTSTAPETKAILRDEFKFIYAPLLNRLGARALSLNLRNRSFQLVDPKRYDELENLIIKAFGMDRPTAERYIQDVAQKLQEIFGERAAVSASLKTPDAVERKLNSKSRKSSEKYETVQALEDLLRFRIVLDQPRDLGEVLTQIGSLDLFSGAFSKRGAPEIKQLPGYNAYHVTFEGNNGKPHEFQIFMTPEEYNKYENGWPNAWWAYAMRDLTGFLPDFEAFDVHPQDLRGNFARYKHAIKPYTFFSMSHREGTAIKLIPRRISHPDSRHGNLIDVAAASIGAPIRRPEDKLDNRIGGTEVYQATYDVEQTPTKAYQYPIPTHQSIGYVIQDGDVIRFIQDSRALIESDPRIASAELSLSSLQGAVELNATYKDNIESLSTAGLKKLTISIGAALGLPKRASSFGPHFQKDVLEPLAIRMDYGDPRHLLAALGLKTSNPFLIESQNKLLDAIAMEVRAAGARKFQTLGVNAKNEDTGKALITIAANPIFHSDNVDDLLARIGLDLVAARDVLNILNQTRTRVRMTEGAPEEHNVYLTMALQLKPIETGHYELDITVDHNQPGITASIVTILSKYGLIMREGTRTVEKEQGAYIHMVLESSETPIDIAQVSRELENLKIPILPSFETSGRLTVSVRLTTLAASNAFFLGLKTVIPKTNIPWFNVGDDAWVEMVLELPKDAEHKSQDAVRFISAQFADLRMVFYARDTRIIQEVEISDAQITDATAAKYLSLLNQHAPWGRWIRNIFANLFSDNQGDIDEREATEFANAIDLALDIHKGEFRKSDPKLPYVTHPFNVASKLIRQGIRDHATLIAALLHDALENYGPRVFQERYGRKPMRGDPEDDAVLNALLMEVTKKIETKFPHIKHQLLNKLAYVSYYKTGSLAAHGRKLTAQGDHNLSALKLADMEDNLSDGFDRANQVAKRIRYGFPIVTQHTEFKNAVYQNPRRDFLRTLILQSNKLSDAEFENIYWQEEAGESASEARTELIGTIRDFLKWARENPDSFPNDLGLEKTSFFISRLNQLSQTLKQKNTALPSVSQNAQTQTFAEPSNAAHALKELSSPDILVRTISAGAIKGILVPSAAGPILLKALAQEPEDSVSEALLSALKDVLFEIGRDARHSFTLEWDLQPAISRLQSQNDLIRKSVAEFLALYGWTPSTSDEKIAYAIALRDWSAPVLSSIEAIPAICHVLYSSMPLDHEASRLLQEKLRLTWPAEQTLPWIAARLRAEPQARLSTSTKLEVIKLHDEIFPAAQERANAVGGKVLILNLDSHDDFMLGHNLSEITPGNWGYFLEEWHEIGYYVWLRSWWDDMQRRVVSENWASDRGVLLQRLRDKLLATDVKAVWLTIDADAYSLRDPADWNHDDQKLDGVYRHITDQQVEKDLRELKALLDQYQIPIERVVFAESEKYLDKPASEVPGYISQLTDLVRKIFILSPKQKKNGSSAPMAIWLPFAGSPHSHILYWGLLTLASLFLIKALLPPFIHFLKRLPTSRASTLFKQSA